MDTLSIQVSLIGLIFGSITLTNFFPSTDFLIELELFLRSSAWFDFKINWRKSMKLFFWMSKRQVYWRIPFLCVLHFLSTSHDFCSPLYLHSTSKVQVLSSKDKTKVGIAPSQFDFFLWIYYKHVTFPLFWISFNGCSSAFLHLFSKEFSFEIGPKSWQE